MWYPRVFNEMHMLNAAISEASSDNPKDIAAKLHGMKAPTHNGGEGLMRADDHQFFQDMYISSFGERGPAEPFDEENTGWGWRIVSKIPADQTVLPTTCKMNKPG